MNPAPDHRYRAVQQLAKKKVGPPEDERLAGLYEYMFDRPCSATVEEAADLFRNAEHRAVMDSFIIAKTPVTDVARAVEVKAEVLETYAYLFMDVSVFRNRLELITYAVDYDGSTYGRELVQAAVKVGTEYLMWAHGKATTVDSRVVFKRTMTDTFYRGLAHRGNAITSNVSKEALRWWGMAVKNAETLETVEPHVEENASNALRIALEAHDDTVPVTKIPVPLDQVLH